MTREELKGYPPSAIPADEIDESLKKGYPTVLVIVAKPYRDQIIQHLEAAGYEVDTKRDSEGNLTRGAGLALLKDSPDSNLGWRTVLAADKPSFLPDAVRATSDNEIPLAQSIPVEYREEVLTQADAYEPPEGAVAAAPQSATEPRPSIKVTSFEGAKGLSAQHVYIVGLHDGELPHDPHAIGDLEICKFIVGLTRTRKKCTLIHTRNFAGTWKTASCFLGWLDPARLTRLKVNAASAQPADQGDRLSNSRTNA